MAFESADYRDRLVIADGDFLSEILARGGMRSDLCATANVECPDVVRDVAEAFLDVGAGFLVTNTMTANACYLAEQLQSGETNERAIRDMNYQGAALLRGAVSDYPSRDGSQAVVLGAVGPVDRFLMLKEVGEETLIEAYRDQAAALAEGGVDAILCRSFTEVEALSVAVRSAKEGGGLPVIGCMAFDCGPDRLETALGVTVPQACEAMMDAGVAMVGCESGEGPDNAVAIVSLMRASCGLPILAEVNAGSPELVEGRVVYPESPAEFAARLRPLAEAGANIVRGGRGASTEHIAAMVDAVGKLDGP